MDVSNLLARDTPQGGGDSEVKYQSRQYPTRHSYASQEVQQPYQTYSGSMTSPTKMYAGPIDAPRASPGKNQKQVTFELLLPEAQHRARLPMRVMISPHDTTESIITTVRNFYGLYEGPGVSFEDRQGNTLIATYENFEQNMFIFVRMTPPDPVVAEVNTRSRSATTSPRKPQLGAPFEMRPPAHSMAQYHSRPASRNANGRSMSPQSSRSHRSMSNALGAKSRSRTHMSKETSVHGETYADGFSDSDGGEGSVSSRREPHASAEISVNNIVEGGRRKRAKFDSSVSWPHLLSAVRKMLNMFTTGIALVCTTTGACNQFHLVRLPSKTCHRRSNRLSFLMVQPTHICLPATNGVSTELWKRQ